MCIGKIIRNETYPQFADIPVVKTSNFIGDTLDMAAARRNVTNPRRVKAMLYQLS